MLRQLVAVFVCLFSFQISLADNDVLNVETDFLRNYKESLTIFRTSMDPLEIEEAARKITGKPLAYELYQVLSERLERMPSNAAILIEVPDLNRVVQLLVGNFIEVASRHDVEMMQELKRWIELDLRDPELIEYTRRAILMMARETSHASERFPDLHTLNTFLMSADKTATIADVKSKDPKLYERHRAHLSALHQVEAFYQRLKSNVIGQEAILESFRTLYLTDLMRGGQRKAPEVFYFMGLPGNGKDTLVEAYVNALWNSSTALESRLFRVTINNKNEAWSLFGSAKGFVGSEEIPAFLRFLVDNSGGKYIIKRYEVEGGKGIKQVIERNPEWKPEMASLFGPHKAVVFINEAHNIPKEVKDTVLKQAIERGIFPVNNPGPTPNAVAQLEVPVTFVFASNEGIDLLEPRQANGTRVGMPLPFERIYENYLRVRDDKQVLKQAIMKANGGVNDPTFPDKPGTSEEFLNRIPENRLHILEPLSPDQLVEVAKLMSRGMIKNLATVDSRLGSYKISITDEMYRFLIDYNYVAAENARPIKSRLEMLIFDPIYRAIQNQKIRPLGRMQEIEVDVQKYENGARSVAFKVTDPVTGETYQFTRLIRETLNDVPKAPLPNERIQEILAMREVILKNVFGVEHIVDRLIEAALVSESESRNSGESKRPATVMAFLGLTSTGKTETAKQYALARHGNRERPVTIDFNGVRSLEAMEAKILGSFDGRKNPIASEFMKAYDRSNGNLTFIFDEAANSPRELLKSLYEILREPVATGFTDGKPRPMKNVTIILTGNAGERIYDMIPPDLPTDVRERAMHEVFRIFINNDDLQQRILTETFPEALLARIGRNVFHFGPLTDQSKREISQLKLIQGLRSLEPKPSERGWNIQFSQEEHLLRLFDMIEKEGFHLNQQGASIDRFVRESVIDKIKSRLLKEAVPSGENILLEVEEKPMIRAERDIEYKFRQITLYRANGISFTVDIPIGRMEHKVGKNPVDRVLTAYHEAGHEIVSEVYFGDRVRPKYLSIIEGVALIGQSLVHYAGVRSGKFIEEYRLTKEAVLRDAAVLAGGYVAQQIVTLGGRHDAGKSNDMHRATALIQAAILKYGLSEEWGTRAVTQGMTVADFIDKELSPSEKARLNEITNDWLRTAEAMAREALLINMDSLFIDMSQEIARRGFLAEKDIAELYERNGVVTERSGAVYDQRRTEVRQLLQFMSENYDRNQTEFHQRFTAENYSFEKAMDAYNWLIRKNQNIVVRFMKMRHNNWNDLSVLQKAVFASLVAGRIADTRRDARLAWADLMPENVANIDAIIESEREKATRPVTRIEKFQIDESRAAHNDSLERILELPGPAGDVTATSCRLIFN